jgi:hypothetical protein
VHRGVYATFSGEPGREAVFWAAVLSAGPGALLSYQSAAELDKLTDEASELVHVTIPSERRIKKAAGLVIHLSARAGHMAHPVLTPPRTRIEETILDLAESAPGLDGAVSWIARGLGRRLTTADKLRAAMRLRTFMRWRRELSEFLSDDLRGLHSLLEFRYVRDVERPHGLPRGTRQARSKRNGRSQYQDVLYEAYCLAIELDGRLAHPAESRWQDMHRDNAAAAGGITTLRYGWMDVTQNPCQVAAQVAVLLRQRGYGQARPCSPGCPVGDAGKLTIPATSALSSR